jgi:hypothetical protein
MTDSSCRRSTADILPKGHWAKTLIKQNLDAIHSGEGLPSCSRSTCCQPRSCTCCVFHTHQAKQARISISPRIPVAGEASRSYPGLSSRISDLVRRRTIGLVGIIPPNKIRSPKIVGCALTPVCPGVSLNPGRILVSGWLRFVAGPFCRPWRSTAEALARCLRTVFAGEFRRHQT